MLGSLSSQFNLKPDMRILWGHQYYWTFFYIIYKPVIMLIINIQTVVQESFGSGKNLFTYWMHNATLILDMRLYSSFL